MTKQKRKSAKKKREWKMFGVYLHNYHVPYIYQNKAQAELIADGNECSPRGVISVIVREI